MHLSNHDAGKTRIASASWIVRVGRSQSRGAVLTERRKFRSSPELNVGPAPFVMTTFSPDRRGSYPATRKRP